MGKKVKGEELTNVNGGSVQGDNTLAYCQKCHTKYSQVSAKKREAGSGCSKYYEFQCPECGTWN